MKVPQSRLVSPGRMIASSPSPGRGGTLYVRAAIRRNPRVDVPRAPALLLSSTSMSRYRHIRTHTFYSHTRTPAGQLIKGKQNKRLTHVICRPTVAVTVFVCEVSCRVGSCGVGSESRGEYHSSETKRKPVLNLPAQLDEWLERLARTREQESLSVSSAAAQRFSGSGLP